VTKIGIIKRTKERKYQKTNRKEMTSVVPRGITVSLGAFCLFYALVSFLLSLLVSTALFVVLGTAFVALVSYYRLPPPPRHAVEAVLGVDYTAYKTATDEPHRSVAGSSDEDTKGKLDCSFGTFLFFPLQHNLDQYNLT
jgi:hypothetical protein